MLIIFITALIAVAVGLIVYHVFRRRGLKERIRASFEQLAATMQLEGARIQQIPMLTLSGDCRTFSLFFEPSVKKMGHKKVECWQISTKINLHEQVRFYLQSETQGGRLRKVADLEVVTTGDGWFDANILLFSDDADRARKIFTPYLIKRFQLAGFSNFVIEVSEGRAVFETYLDIPISVRALRHQIDIWMEFLNVIGTACL